MASFKTHYNVGLISGIFAIGAIGYLQMVSFFEGIVALALFVLGSLFPDIDAPNSRITKALRYVLSPILGLLLWYYGKEMTDVKTLSLVIASALIVWQWLLPFLITKCTFHRGIFHSIPMGIFIGGLVAIGILHIGFSREFALLVGGAFSMGYMVHLLLDEIYSVDMANVRIKRSFGTAFKFYEKKEKAYTLMVYVALFGEYWYFFEW